MSLNKRDEEVTREWEGLLVFMLVNVRIGLDVMVLIFKWMDFVLAVEIDCASEGVEATMLVADGVGDTVLVLMEEELASRQTGAFCCPAVVHCAGHEQGRGAPDPEGQ